MVDKTNSNNSDSDAQKSSEELFLRGSEKDHALRDKSDNDGLKLEDSQEELSLQNILLGSEQSETPNKGSEEKGAGDTSEAPIGDRSETASYSTDANAIENAQGEVIDGEQSGQNVNHHVNDNNTDSRLENNDQDTRRVLANSDEGLNKTSVAQSFSADNETLVPEPNVNDSGDIPFQDDISEEVIENIINSAPVAEDNIEQNVDEGASSISGQVIATDADPTDVLSYQVLDSTSIPDGFSLSSDGSWQFYAQHETYDHLNVGDSIVVTVPVVVTDNAGASDTAQIQITIFGTNDAPVAGVAINNNIDEGATPINGQFVSTDVDDAATATWSVSPGSSAPDGFILNTDGSYAFDPADSTYDHLKVGDSEVLTIPVTVTDDNGATDTSQIQITISGTNDAPIAGASVSTNVNEGAAIINGQLTSTDIDDGAISNWSVSPGSSAPDGFVLNTDGSYAFDPADSTYDHLKVGDSEVLTIPVMVTDDNGATDTTQVEITVSGTNDAPTAIVITGGVVDENSSASTVVAQMTTQDVDDGETFTYSIADDPSGLFEISGDQIIVKAGADINFEAAESHEVSVQVTDANGLTYSQSVTLTVNDVNEDPVNIELNNFQIDEISGDADQVTLGDFGNGVVGQDGASGTGYMMLSEENVHDRFSDNPIHSQSADNLVTVKNIDGQWFYDTNTQYIPFSPEPSDRLVAELDFSSDTATLLSGVSDPSNQVEGINAGYIDGDFSITVNRWGGSNNAGEFGVSGTYLNVAPEVDLNVGTVTAIDPDADTLSYSLSDNSDGAFQIDSQTGEITIADVTKIDFEDAQSHDVTVRVSDGQGGVTEQVFTIQLNDVNEAPDLVVDTAIVNEDGSVTVDVLANDSDPDAGDQINLDQVSIVSGDGQVSIVDGKLVFDANGEYDSLADGEQATVEINYTAVDNEGLSSEATVNINVTGTNDAPEYLYITDGQVAVDVGDINNGVVAQDGATGNGYLMLSEENVHDRFSDNPIHSQSADNIVTVKNIDGEWFYDTNTQYIPFTPEPGDRLIAELDFSNDSAILLSGITDPNNQIDGINAGYSDGDISINVNQWAGNNNAGEFGVSGSTINIPNEVQATSISESISNGTSVATVIASDAEGDTLQFTLLDNSDGRFAIDADSGEISIANAGAINYEEASEHQVNVQISDGNGGVTEQSITIDVSDVNEAPTNIDLSNSDVDENSVAGTVVATLTTTDEDAAEAFSYILNDGSGFFEISGDQIVVKDGADIDFESAQSHDISVEVTDSSGNTYTEDFTINVNDVIENLAPDAVDDVSDSFTPENATLTSEINFDGGVPVALLGSVTTEADGQVGDAADFSSAKVEVNNLALNGDAGAQTTVSMWIQANPEGGWEMLAASDRYDMVMLNGDIGFNTAGGDMFGTDASELADGEWHHIVGVFTNGDVSQNTIYIDGVAQEMSQIQGTPNNSVANIDSSDGSLHFGSWGANDNYRFSGSMDEVKVYDGVLSNGEVTQLYDLEADNLSWNGGSLGAQEDTVVTINSAELLANDTDPDGDILTISSVETGEHGTVELDAEGNVQFTPDENYNGEATFTYTVSDGNGGEDTATVTLNVNSVNDLPVINIVNSITVDEDGSQQITYSTSDIDSSNVVVTGDAANGNVVVNSNGTVTFTPDENYYGDDTIVLTATDSDGGITTQKISVTVNPIQDSPDAVDDGNFEPQSATLAAELTFDQGVPNAVLGAVTTESNGQVGDAADFNSAIAEVSGIDLDGTAGAQTTVSMWVQTNPEGGWEMLAASNYYDMVTLNGDIGFNTAGGDMYGTDASELADGEWHHVVGVFTNGDVTQNRIYIDGVEQQMSQIQGTPSSSRANIDSAGGSLFFGGWGGNNNYTFTGSMDEVKVFNGVLSADEVSTLNDIEATNSKWDATSLSTDEDVALVIDPSQLLANDVDVDGDVLTITSVQDAQNGTVEIDGDGNVLFTPDANYSGEATFSYTIDDGNGNTDSASVTLNVNSANDAPNAGADVVTSVDEGAALVSGQLTATDIDDGATASWSISAGSTAPDGFVLNDDGSYSFDPTDGSYDHLNVGDSEVITIPVTVTDDNGTTDTTQVQITISGTNDALVAGVAVTTSVDEGSAVINGQITSSDVDDGSTAVYSISAGSTAPDGFTINADGSYSFDPGDSAYDYLSVGDNVVLSIPVTVTDDNGATDSTQVEITIQGTNDSPEVQNVDLGSTNEGSSIVITEAKLLANSSDVDSGATLSVDSLTLSDATQGTITDNGDGTWSFDPANDYSADDVAFDFTVTDGSATNSATAVIDIAAVADAPTLTATPKAWGATNEVISVTEGAAAVAGGFTISVDGWQTTSDAIEQRTTYSSSEGDWHFELNTDSADYYPDAANIYQDVQTHDGASYELSFDFSARPGVDENTSSIEVLWDGVVIDTISADGSGLSDSSWSTFNYTVTGDGDISRLEFRENGIDLDYGRGGFLDNISLTETSSGFTATGDEDTTILLPELSMTLNDQDGSESAALTIGDIPVGAVLSDGANSFTASTGSTSVDITSWNNDSMSVTPPLDFDGQFDLTITGTATESSNGDLSSTVETLTVNVIDDNSEGEINSIYGTNSNNNLAGTAGDDYISGRGGNDTLRGGEGDDVLTGGSGNDNAFGEAGNDTYVVNPFGGDDSFTGGDAGGWIDVIDVSVMAANDPDNPWTIQVSGVQVEYDIAAGALELNPDTAGVISFSDGSELTFNGVEKIEW